MDHKEMFVKVETFARLRGRLITSVISAPRGISYERYLEIDRSLVRAFGNENSRTIGTFADNKKMALIG